MFHRRRSLRSRPVHLSAALALAALTVGCARERAPTDDDPGSATDERITLELPVAEGSAQPRLSSDGDRLWLSWLEPDGPGPEGDLWALRVAPLDGLEVGPPRTVVTRDDLFVNWADFPSVEALADGRLVAHWLQRSAAGTYAYGIRLSWSDDEGATWTDPWIPHDDLSPTEHGFVTLMPGADGEVGALWLDGRRYADTEAGPATEEMTLRFRQMTGPADAGAELLVDDRVCDCCQTGAALTDDGWVMVYRDRAEDEVRDIYATRVQDGEWTEPLPVHRDGWRIEGCPVNGPAVAAHAREVAVAWFTGAGEVPRVLLAFSDDSGDRFTEPVRVDDGDPVGRVDVVSLAGGALVSWIERTPDGAELRVRRVDTDRTVRPAHLVAPIASARASGFPRMLRDGDDLVFAWTDAIETTTRVRAVRWLGGAR